MNIDGLKVDAQAIADGLYQIICDRGQEAIVAFGMIPKEIIDLVEKLIRDRVIELAANQHGVTVTEFLPFVDEAKLRAIVNPIVHEITVGIYAAAQRAGKMCV
ncbi:MAG TPA: hypothetical protein VL171_00820 [Verrucomicrobiae bacterium]|nr:hypothetical protein [Verrucomicrobiae bacterium]